MRRDRTTEEEEAGTTTSRRIMEDSKIKETKMMILTRSRTTLTLKLARN